MQDHPVWVTDDAAKDGRPKKACRFFADPMMQDPLHSCVLARRPSPLCIAALFIGTFRLLVLGRLFRG
jgi:hypothetical protein